MRKWKLIMAVIGTGLLGSVLASCGMKQAEILPPESFQQSRAPDETGGNEMTDNKIGLIDPKILNPENNEPENDKPESNATENNATEKDDTESQNVELVALADTEEQAREIAALYQIELLSFSNGVAVYTTDQEPGDLIALGQQNGYPALSVNYKLELY